MFKTFVAFFALVSVRFAKQTDDGLVLVHIICRHGNRTPRATYNKDPYKHERFYPYGIGQLTKSGKLEMYNVGEDIKRRYKKFLGNFYVPWQVKVRSSSLDRCQMTAQLVIAGMYPPTTTQLWHKNLFWQPIPVNILSPEHDDIFLAERYCKKFIRLQKEYVREAIASGKFRKYESFFKKLSVETGEKVEKPEDVFRLYDTLKCQRECGLKLPLWADDKLIKHMITISKDYWKDYILTDQMKRLGAGYMLEKIVQDTSNKINGNPLFKEMKFYLYSGHDSNIVSVLSTLGVYVPEITPYGAYITIEIHKKNKDFFVKVFYQNNHATDPELQKLDGEPMTEFERFVEKLKIYFPKDEDECK